MDENFKEAVRLLLEAADECRKHDENYGYITSADFKRRLMEFMANYGMPDPQSCIEKLGYDPTQPLLGG